MESARCKAFVAAAETGSFTAAGKELDYTPSGVSQLVRALETELGLILLSRRNRGVTLTREGEKIYPKVVEYIECERLMMDVADEIAGLVKGEITIATYPSIAANLLPGILKEFGDIYPGVSLRIIEGSKVKIRELLNDNVADLAFCSIPDDMSCDFIPLIEDRMIAILPRDHRYAKVESFPLSECVHEDLIMPAKGNDLDVIKVFKDNNIDYRIKFTTMEDYTAARMVEAGLGISITNEMSLKRTVKADYVTIPVEPLTTVSYGMCVPSADSLPPAVRRFMDLAAERMGAD